MSKPAGYVIVRHSAFYTLHTEFTRAVESIGVEKRSVLDRVDKVGGIWFPSYEMAEAFEDKANYPPGHKNGIIPNCQGRFCPLTIEGQHVYLPVREVVG